MNPVDHPHGGGEGKSGQGNPHPVSPWGQQTKGYKTRHNKRTDSMIVQRRRKHRGVTTMPRSLKKGPFVDLHLLEEGARRRSPRTTAARSRPGRAVR